MYFYFLKYQLNCVLSLFSTNTQIFLVYARIFNIPEWTSRRKFVRTRRRTWRMKKRATHLKTGTYGHLDGIRWASENSQFFSFYDYHFFSGKFRPVRRFDKLAAVRTDVGFQTRFSYDFLSYPFPFRTQRTCFADVNFQTRRRRCLVNVPGCLCQRLNRKQSSYGPLESPLRRRAEKEVFNVRSTRPIGHS